MYFYFYEDQVISHKWIILTLNQMFLNLEHDTCASYLIKDTEMSVE